MKKLILKGCGILLFAAAVSGCAGTRNLATKNVSNSEALLRQETQLSEEEQKQFEFLFVEALKQKMFGNAQKAIQLFSSCLEIDPNSSAAMYELANIHASNGDFTSASLLLEKAISLNPSNKWYKLLLAQIYQQTNKFSEAADIYTELLKVEPENLQYRYMQAALLTNANRLDQALQAYDKMEQKYGINEQVSVAKQQIYISMGKVDKAFEEINKLIEAFPGEAKYYGLLADLYQSQGDKENALKYYKKILELDPENGFVHFSLANYYFKNGELEKAFEETTQGFLSDGIDLQTKLQLYMMLTSDKAENKLSAKQQLVLIEILKEKHPDEAMVHNVYAELLLRQNKIEKARSELLQSLAIDRNSYVVWERILFIDNDLQDWKGLYQHSASVIELFPNQPQGYFFHAIACAQLEKYSEVIKAVDDGIDFVINNPQLKANFYMLKGEAYYKQNKRSEAFKWLDKAVELDPDNYITLNNYAYYLSEEGVQLDKAERMSGKVVEHFPDNPTYLDTHAWVLFKKGEYTLAKFYMESAIKNGGNENPTLLEHYGDILFKYGKKDEALQYWLKAKEYGGNSEILFHKIREKTYIEEKN